MIIGVTGKSGVGKSTYANKIAKELNAVHINIDIIGHQVLDDDNIKKQIKEKFGIEVSSTNRKQLGELVFDNRHNMKELSDITYEAMKEKIYQIINENTNVVLDWILLPHSEFFNICDKKILIKPLEEEKRIQMVLQRDNISLDQLKLRDKASIEYNEDDFDEVIIQKYN